MIKNIKLEVALLSDINGIVALQELYLVSNLSDKEKNLALSPPVHRTSASCNYRQAGLFIAKDNDRVIAYLFTGSWDFFSQWPIFNHITAQFPNLNFDFDITTTHTFQYGPICIAKEYQQS
jgi:hypothetical protein